MVPGQQRVVELRPVPQVSFFIVMSDQGDPAPGRLLIQLQVHAPESAAPRYGAGEPGVITA
jgi:hypothetical protein